MVRASSLAARLLCAIVSSTLAGEPVGPTETVAVPTVAKPGYLQPFIDPVFGSSVTRITGDVGEGIPNVEARWDAVARH